MRSGLLPSPRIVCTLYQIRKHTHVVVPDMNVRYQYTILVFTT